MLKNNPKRKKRLVKKQRSNDVKPVKLLAVQMSVKSLKK